VTRRLVLSLILIVSLVASALVGVQRLKVESRNRAVDVVIDYNEVAQVVAGSGMSPIDVLRRLKSAGVTGVAVTEQTMRDLIANGLVIPYGGQRFAVSGEVVSEVTNRLCMILANGRDRVKSTPVAGAGYSYLTIHEDLPMDYIEELPVGFSKQAIEQVRAAGLEVVGRIINYAGATPRAIDSIIADTQALGIRKVVFMGDQVLGYRGATKATALAIRRNDLLFGRIEFAKQKGELDIAKRVPDKMLVVHSITQNEMPTLNAVSIADRFRKAVRERGVRMVYVRMLETASGDLVEANADYISLVAKDIRAAGYTIGGSHPLGEVTAPTYLRALAGAGVGAGTILLLLTIVDLSTFAFVFWSIAALIICSGLPVVGDIGQKAVALLSAFVFPMFAVLAAVRSAPQSPTPAQAVFIRSLLRLVAAVALTVAGGVLVVGLLSSREYMLRVEQFAGIKVAQVVPILMLTLLFAGNVAWSSDVWDEQKRKLFNSLRNLFTNPILMWQAIGLVVVLAIIGIMVARSGNEAGLEVSTFELKVRALLDRVMFVRPRTKEFLVGYPALVLGITFALRGRRRWAAPLLVLGSIGLVSALNTFCHIHTPLAVSTLRSLNGLIAGGVIGLIVYTVLRNLPGRENKPS